MSDPWDNKDDDTIIIKPMTYTGTILLSAGAGLLAGLLICWLFCGQDERNEEQQAVGGSAGTSHHAAVAVNTAISRPRVV